MLEKNGIHIIGAGLVGTLLSIFLAKKGFQVEILEKREDIRKNPLSSGRSINLSLSHRGIKALNAVELDQTVHQLTVPMYGREVHDVTGVNDFQKYGLHHSDVHYSISRRELNALLLDEAEKTGNVKIRFGVDISDIDFDEQTYFIKQDNQAQKVKYNVLFAADGSNSFVRQQLNLKDDTYEQLTHGYKEIIIPAVNDQYVLKKQVLHIWPRHDFMLMAMPNNDGSFTATLYMPYEGEISFAAITDQAKLMNFFIKHFPDVIPIVPNLDQQFFSNQIGNLGTVKCYPWTYKNTLLIGDSAHAVVPFHGQGMNCGFEDCEALSAIIDKNNDWSNVFDAFQNSRKFNADAIAEMAKENYLEMRDHVCDPKFKLKKAVAFKVQQRYPDSFIPRYAMVMFDDIPYSVAKEMGIKQEQLLQACCHDIQDPDQLDFKLVDKLMGELIA